MNTVKYIDLFAGLGGIRLGFSSALKEMGIESECVFSSEIKDYAITAYRNFYQEESVAGDIAAIPTSKIPDFDFLLAGFPCQPFSSAGKRMGFADTRGTLFFEIERILREKKSSNHPAKGFLLENVEGLVNHDNGNTLKVIIENLSTLGYEVSFEVLDGCDFGLAQSRKRIYIVGLLDKKVELTNFSVEHRKLGDIIDYGLQTVDSEFTRLLLKNYSVYELYGKAIKDKRGGADNIHSWDIELKGETSERQRDLLNRLLKERRKKKWAEEIGIKWMDGMPLTEAQIRTFCDYPTLHEDLQDLKKKGYLTLEHPKELVDGVRIPDKSKQKGYNIVAGKLSFEFSKILDPDDLAPTLVAMDVSRLGIVDGEGIRHLSIREGQRLFGYPDEYDLSMLKTDQAFDLLGNTVCVPVIKAVSKKLYEEYVA